MKRVYILGVTIFVFGLIFLLRNLGLLTFTASFWSLFYPVVIISVGLVVIFITHEGRKLVMKIRQIFKSD